MKFKILQNFAKYRNPVQHVLIGTFIGATAASVGCYFDPSLAVYRSDNNPLFGFKLIKKLTDKNPILKDAAIVKLSQSASQFGKEFHDNLTHEGRKSAIVHPYDKQGSGAVVAPIYYNNSDNELYLLFIRKLKARNKLELGLKDEYEFPTGYTSGAPVENGHIKTETYEESEARNTIEDAQLTGLEQIQKFDSQLGKQQADKEYFAKINQTITDYFKENIENDPYIMQFDYKKAKAKLKSAGVVYEKDFNNCETADREFKEETGYNGVTDLKNYKLIDVVDNYGGSNIANLHTIVGNYAKFHGEFKQSPKIYPAGYKGEREANSFVADNSEIGELIWMPISKIKQNADNSLTINDIPVRLNCIPLANNAIKYAREKILGEESQGKIISEDNLIAWQKSIGHFLVKPNSEFSVDSKIWSNQQKCWARKIGENHQLDKINQECNTQLKR